MKTIIVDRSKWRCGGKGDIPESESRRGKGLTLLRNNEGYQCCLGFAAKSLSPGMKNSEILGLSVPGDVNKKILKLNVRHADVDGHFYGDTELSRKAMEINDDETISQVEREKKLKALFSKNGVRLKFVGSFGNV